MASIELTKANPDVREIFVLVFIPEVPTEQLPPDFYNPLFHSFLLRLLWTGGEVHRPAGLEPATTRTTWGLGIFQLSYGRSPINLQELFETLYMQEARI